MPFTLCLKSAHDVKWPFFDRSFAMRIDIFSPIRGREQSSVGSLVLISSRPFTTGLFAGRRLLLFTIVEFEEIEHMDCRQYTFVQLLVMKRLRNRYWLGLANGCCL